MDTLNMLAFLVGGGFTFTAFITFVGRLFTTPVTGSVDAIKASLWKSFLLGLVNAVVFVPLAALMINFARSLNGLPAGLVVMLALAIFAALGILASIGLAGFSHWWRERFTGGERTLTTSLKSTLLLVLACMAPFMGWFLLTPFVIATGLGASIQMVFRRKNASPDAPAVEQSYLLTCIPSAIFL